MPIDFSVERTRVARTGRRPAATRFIVTRKSDEGGRDAYWKLSPTALRLLAERLQDALDQFESSEMEHAGTRLHDDSK